MTSDSTDNSSSVPVLKSKTDEKIHSSSDKEKKEAHQGQSPSRSATNRNTGATLDNARSSDQYTENLLSINRVTKVVEGGRIFSFSACVVVGNKKGSVGFAKGKASEALDAKSKAIFKAKKKIIKIPLYKKRTIYHDVVGTSGTTKIFLKKAPPGKGIIAGPVARSVLSACGIKDIVAKSHGSNNVYTTVRAVFDALSNLYTPRFISNKRGKNISEISVIQQHKN